MAEDFICEYDIAPEACIVDGYRAGVMPTGYEDALEEEQLKALVDFFWRSYYQNPGVVTNSCCSLGCLFFGGRSFDGE
jgi:hypothetical protein